MKYYLIDYENVNAAGLEGIDDVSTDSRVVLFYTKNSSKIDLGVFNLLRSASAELAVIEVHHGKQALDIQLASYVGFLIGTEPADTEYYIVSKDKGYRNIQDFWSDRHIVLCTSLREDSEIVDEPKPASSRSRSSRGGRRSSSQSAAKAGEKQERPDRKETGKAEGRTEGSDADEEKTERRSSGKKGIRTKAEQNSKREKDRSHTEAHTPDAAAMDLADAVKTAPAEPKAQAPAAEAPKAETAPKQAPVMNAFAEAAALAKAMAEAKSADSSENALIVKSGDASRNAPAGEADADAGKATVKEDADKETADKADKKKKPAAKTAKKSGGRKKSAKAADPAPAESEAAEEPAPAEAKPASRGRKKKAEPKDEPKKEAKKDAKKEDKPKASVARNEANTEIQKILSKEGFSGDIINAAASFVSKNIGKDGCKQLIYRGLIKNHGKEQGLAIYRLIKGSL